MKQDVITFPSMHADHRAWQADHAMWHDDLEQWRTQLRSALTQLTTLEVILGRYSEQFNEHEEAIKRVERSLQDHEIGMANYERDGYGAELQEAMVKNHCQQASRHTAQREAHEQIKKHHHAIMVQVAALKAVIEQ